MTRMSPRDYISQLASADMEKVAGKREVSASFLRKWMDFFFFYPKCDIFCEVLIKNLMMVSYSNSTFHLFGYLLMH